MRFWLGFTSVVMVAAAARTAHAEIPADSLSIVYKTPKDGVDPGSTLVDDFAIPADDIRPRQFNRARCECDETGITQNVMFEVTWANPAMPPADRSGMPLYAWVGSGCDTSTNIDERNMRCTGLDDIGDALDVDDAERLFVGVGELLTPGTAAMECAEGLTTVVYGLYTSPNAEADLSPAGTVEITTDMKAPPLPSEVTVLAQEGQIKLDWTTLTSDAGDIDRFYALCTTAAGLPAHDSPTHNAEYDTVDSLCGEAPLAAEVAQPLTITNDAVFMDRPMITEPELGDLRYLDKFFVCGQATGGTASEITLGGLQNGVDYKIVLVSADKAGNARAAYVPRMISPQPVEDFWEDLNEENPEVEGGLCLVESTYGAGGGGLNGALRAWRDELRQTGIGSWFVDRYYQLGAPLAAAARESVVARVVIGIVMLPLVAIALVWHAIGLPAMLAIGLALVLVRRRRKKLVAAAAITLAPALASAQSMTPYWDDDLAAESAETSGPKWHFGLRLGPYLPDIDDDRFGDPGPYERMFGSGGWMPALDLHRLWNTRFGQFGGGGSIGYFQKTAEAYIPGTMERAEGNENTLKIVPMQLTAIWRGTMFHDNWGIPLVPYARGGAAYYLWWVRRPDGDLAKACPPNMTNCDRAIGGSLGLVGAAGLAIRAEGIDPDSARSMRDSGLDHAGFYAEVELAWVNGFGNAKKLSLGDMTWFAGIDFEF